jgi:uncharacterized membrane protein YphA (DoxX/SURF4 family)
VLGLAEPSWEQNGSGDRTWDYVQLLAIAILAAIATAIWSVADRRRAGHPRLAAGARVVLRYYVGYMMLSYGVSKVFKLQFHDLRPGDLERRLGDMSPMGLAWTFMGYSTPYTMFAGLAEVIGGALLLWRRTATLGALVIVAVMTNVVMLNFCYDIPVKLFSSELLIMAIAIAAPGARRLIAAALGRATPEVAERERMSPRLERVRQVARLVLILVFAWAIFARPHSGRNDHVHELYGAWVVDTLVLGGVDRSPATDPDRWQKVLANPLAFHIITMSGGHMSYEVTVDAAHHTLTVNTKDLRRDDAPQPDSTNETWTYSRPAPDRLTLDGVHLGKPLHATLHLAPGALLMTRGFRWINEMPFNR